MNYISVIKIMLLHLIKLEKLFSQKSNSDGKTQTGELMLFVFCDLIMNFVSSIGSLTS